MNIVDLTKQLIAIPSFVDGKINETCVADFLWDFLQQNFPALKLKKQYIEAASNRYNILASGSKNPELLVVGHIDTVQPNIDWSTNPLEPIAKNGKLYGLGAADMKGSIAACLAALQKTKKTIDMSKVMLFLYTDEEYDFKGMKKFIEKPLSIKPRIIFNLDGDKDVASGCRGLIELRLTLRGKSYHASKPFMGVNVIRQTTKVIDALEKEIASYKDPFLGQTTLNLAYMQASTVFEDKGKRIWQKEGNIIPDFAETILELRPAVKEVTAEFVLTLMRKLAISYDITIDKVDIRHDISPWPVSFASQEMENIQKIYADSGVRFETANMEFGGYVDTQMLAEKVDCPIFIAGTGGENQHGADENVSLKDLEDTEKIYEQIFLYYCK